MPKILKPERPDGFIMHQSAKIDVKKEEKMHPEYDRYIEEKDKNTLRLSDSTANKKIINDIFAYKINKEINNKKAPEKKEFTTRRREQEMNIEKIAELLKNNKIDQIIIAGENRPNLDALKKNPKSKEKIFTLRPDLDAYTALYALNNFNNRSPEETFSETSVISAQEKNGNGKKEAPEKKGGLIIYLDTGGNWMKVEKDGETTTIYIDHHGSGQREATSGTKMMLDIMEKAGMLKELPPWFKKFADFVNDIDNLSYIEKKDEKGRKIFNENYFRNEWPNSLYALAEKQIPFETLMELCQNGTITDLDRPFTKEELDGKIGQTKIGNSTIKELCQKQKEEVRIVLEEGINNAIKENKRRGLHLENTKIGKVVYHNFYKKKNGKSNIILDHLAFKATKAKQYDSYAAWNKKDNSFFINSLNPHLSEIVKQLNEIDPGCAQDIRGVMVYGKSNIITEEQFLNIISPNILKDSADNENKQDLIIDLEEYEWTEEDEKELNNVTKEIELIKKRLEEINIELAQLNNSN